MKTPIEIGKKFKEKIVAKYPTLNKSEIPTNYTVSPIEYKQSAIEKYHVIFWHRLLRKLYDDPIEIECEIIDKISKQKTEIQTVFLQRKLENNSWETKGIDEATSVAMQAGNIKLFPINWKYFVRLPSGGIVALASKDKNTIFYLGQLINPDRNSKNESEESEAFIDLLLEEANRLKGQLFNPSNEFKRQEKIQLYLLVNVYLSNYLSAKTMLGAAEGLEAGLRKEFLRYDARTSDLYNEEIRKHLDQHILTCGMYYCSAISYFFMALEGFINLVFHAFLKNRFRDNQFRADQRFDLEQKIRLMPFLCEGFKENSDIPTSIFSDFRKLKSYRNSLFHSKVEDSLKGLCFFEDGFAYTYDLSEYEDNFLPVHKIKLTVTDVIEVKKMVDGIVNYILDSMDQVTRNTTEKTILIQPQIPISVLKTGDLEVG